MALGAALLMVVTAAGWGQAAAQTGTSEELPDEATEIPEDTPDEIPGEIPEDTPGDATEDIPGVIPEEVREEELVVCVAARRRAHGGVEVGLLRETAGGACGERLLPQQRNLPADAAAGAWLTTAPVEVDGEQLRVAARKRSDGRVEFAVQRRSGDGAWGPRLLPRLRFVSADGATGRWQSSSPVDAFAPPQGSYLESAQIVTLYGYPGVRSMGILGRGSPEQVADQAAELAADFDRLNGDREVIGAFHLITGVAQAHPTPDGTWISRMPHELIAEYVELARERGMHVFLDEQIGWSDPLTEVQKLEPFLLEPFVHVAIDPEFATRRNERRPGLAIGSVTANEINDVQRYLAELVTEESLPPKILMVHQFTPYMVADRADVAEVPEVDLSIDMDGFGGIGIKLRHYGLFAVPEPSEWPAFKVFLRYDTPPMTPEQIMELNPPPDIIVYQ